MLVRSDKFKELFLPFHAKLYRIAYRFFENEDDAKDITQELYLKLWNMRNNWDVVNNPEAYSVTLLKNLCIDCLRNKKTLFVRRTVALTVINERDEACEEKEVDIGDQVKTVKRLIMKLPENQQRIMTLRDIKECSMEEIVDITGLNAVNVRVLLSRARKEVREQFKQMRTL